MELVRPTMEHLASYVAALQRGWSADNTRGSAAADEELERIGQDASAFVALCTDREAAGPPVTLPDGSKVPRIPGYRMWMWDGEFSGMIGLRWQPGTTDLPPHVLGHIGYAVVPWKQRRGYATQALAQMLRYAKDEGLAHVDLTTDEDNLASQKVMRSNGAVFVERFRKPPSQGGTESLRFRIALATTLAILASPANGDCNVQSDSQSRALVELYTSEGCSSCPPADHWLSELAVRGDKRVVPLAFHVSYWDYIGWKDRFADARYTERQRDVAQAQGASMVYTPQVMIGGQDFPRWSSTGAVDRAVDGIAKMPASARIMIASKPATDSGIDGNASLQSPAKSPNVALYVALTQDGLSSKVTAGENRGENLHHHAVVRDLAVIAPGGGAFHFARKPDWDPAHMSIVAFAQDTGTGRVLQAMSMAACR